MVDCDRVTIARDCRWSGPERSSRVEDETELLYKSAKPVDFASVSSTMWDERDRYNDVLVTSSESSISKLQKNC